ncbi:hypothetical protein LCGC14_1425250, partial [marine sediment metagenome]
LTIPELFDTARRMLTVRALQALRLDWELFVEALIADTRAGNVKDRRRFGNLLRGEMRRFAGRAYLDGLTDGGILDATLSDSDEKKIQTMLAEQSDFVSGLSETLFKGGGISDAQAAGKPRQWWASILKFYQEGFASAGANPMMEFVGAFGSDPCATCKHLFGQRHRLNVWRKNGLGMVGGSFVGQRTICGKGGHCKHQIVTVVARASGSIRSADMSEEVRVRLDEILAEWEAMEAA